MGKTFVKCAKLYPHERQCRTCPHKNCSLRDLNYPMDFNEEHGYADYADEQRELTKEAI